MAEEKEPKIGPMWLLSSALLGAILAVVGMTLSQRAKPAAIEILPPLPTFTPAPSATPGPLRVYITGAVNHPAVYELPDGSIVADAVMAAGDFSEDAARELINLALPLRDGMQVHVPALIPDGDQLLGVPDMIITPAFLTDAGDARGQRVNINTAGVDELDALPGVGPTIAQNIIDYRQTNGAFRAIEDILHVSGIGPAKFEQMKELITVD